jgi:hypothetical protein
MGNIPKGDKNEIDNKATAADSASDNTSEVDKATAPPEVLVKKKVMVTCSSAPACVGSSMSREFHSVSRCSTTY